MTGQITTLRLDLNKQRLGGIRSAIVFATTEEQQEEFPLLYIKRPKAFSEAEFDEILNSLSISTNNIISTTSTKSAIINEPEPVIEEIPEIISDDEFLDVDSDDYYSDVLFSRR